MNKDPIQPLPINRRTSDHLANERTFLAWIRTGIAVIGLGFVVARFSVWMRQFDMHLEGAVHPDHHTGLSLPLGLGMMAAGGLLAVLAASRYRRVRRAIDENESAAAHFAVTLVTLVTMAITGALVIYMIVAR